MFSKINHMFEQLHNYVVIFIIMNLKFKRNPADISYKIKKFKEKNAN